MKVCFVSTRGKVRAAMAKSIFTKLAKMLLLNVEVYSAGIEPEKNLPENVIKVLTEKGYPVEGIHPVGCESLPYDRIDILITLSPEARDRCPYYINHKRREHWVLEEVKDQSDLAKLRSIRDNIERLVKEFLKISHT
ncbi:low molecular weight phosphatase family protein [Thermocrinis sp.]|uniref:arsenate reductase/protein-tyrosine-phosphatase family protein n=1 Tax=Thermocrinis sp. TaxID=2024383 RepID=UPI002FDE5D98